MSKLADWLRENSAAFRHRYPAEVVTTGIGYRLRGYGRYEGWV